MIKNSLHPGIVLQVEQSSNHFDDVLTTEALEFITKLHRTFNSRRLALLQDRDRRQKLINQGKDPSFLETTENIRKNPSWKVAAIPSDLQKRWVEITGPTDKKMLINALNSGADIYMADFEDSNAPTWNNMVEGQQNLIEAVRGTLHYKSSEGKEYQLNPQRAVLMVRPRGWHLDEKHVQVDGHALSGSLFDFGLYFFHNAKQLIQNETGPYFYLAKLENHLEARLWNDVFLFAQEELGIPRGTIRATVLIETILAAFEMEEILYELREHSAGLNAGRWDYIFSIIKKFHERSDLFFPDRSEITMTVPFMRAYTELLVQTCHKRSAQAMGGMAAFVPSRKNKEINEIALAKVREDKERESTDGFDGTWVAHPDLVPIAREIFAKNLNGKPNQIERKRGEVHVSSNELLNFHIHGGKITEIGVRKNIHIALLYLNSWLSGTGAVAIDNLMEDVATAEISRALLWLWVHHPKAKLDNGIQITPELYSLYADEELERIKELFSSETIQHQHLSRARQLLDRLVLSKEFPNFLTQNTGE